VVGIVAAAIALGAYLWWRRRQARAGAATEWHAQLSRAYVNARAARDLLHDEAGEPIEPDRLASMRHQADAAAAELIRLASAAPDITARTQTQTAAQALGAYTTAIDSEQLLRTQTPPASEDALADANVIRRARADELDNALTSLGELEEPSED
jgi:hypothetical protein